MSDDDPHLITDLHAPTGGPAPSLRCPECRHEAILGAFGNVPDVIAVCPGRNEVLNFGQRRCPNQSCQALLFVIMGPSGVVASYPPEVLDFDATDLPEQVLASFEEAISCHATNCFRAAAIMVRRTLEEICHDREATGADLADRLRDLGTKVVMPPELLQGLQRLRLLGNDAAHIEAKTYDLVGRPEVEVAIDVTKEVLKAVYQYRDLIARLDLLTRDPAGDAAPG